MAKIINFLIYGYTPSLAWNVTLLSFFALSALVHSYQAYRSRFWIFFPTLVLGALVEVVGYAGRVWSSKDVYVLTPYLMQICLLIMAPVFFSAFLYIVLGMAIHRLGPQYSLLSPRMYFFTFIIADIVSLILQAVGGGQAASGAGTGKPTQSATNIMVAGIIFQLVTMAIFMSCGVDFAIRRTKDKPYSFRVKRLGEGAAQSGELGSGPTGSMSGESAVGEKGTVQEDKAVLRKWWSIMLAVLVSSTMILLRGFFRSVELSEGWGGFLVTHENFQASLDGIPMVIAVGIFNFIHPGLILGPKSSWKGYY